MIYNRDPDDAFDSLTIKTLKSIINNLPDDYKITYSSETEIQNYQITIDHDKKILIIES